MAEHRWSGWPGAWCLDCGAEDPFEIALADGWWGPNEKMDGGIVWDTEEHRLEVEKKGVCPVEEKKPISELYKPKDE